MARILEMWNLSSFKQGSQTHCPLAAYGSSFQSQGHLTDPISVTPCYSAHCQRIFWFKMFSVMGLGRGGEKKNNNNQTNKQTNKQTKQNKKVYHSILKYISIFLLKVWNIPNHFFKFNENALPHLLLKMTCSQP